ncbi:condensation domain-containing protein, partial [Mycobacterium stomatepiae]|uniref:condensation domain-containing protein n=1 Tax=Mycobacterium stomatepiae TaxID=470076 RepID=UPI0021F32D2E
MLNFGAQSDVLGPLTAAQWSMWAAQQLQPEVAYNFAGYLMIDHFVDLERLSVAYRAAATRFGTPCARLALRDGEPIFVVDRSFPETVRCIDLRAECDPVAAAHQWMNNDCRQPLDLLRDRLTEFALLRISDGMSFFYLRTHHTLSDGYGASNFVRHLAAVYSGSVEDAAVDVTADVDFSDFAFLRDADRKYQESSRSAIDAEYWKSVVREPMDVTDLAGVNRLVAPRYPMVRELVCKHRLLNTQGNQLYAARVVATLAAFISKTTGRQNIWMSLPVSARTTAALKKSAGMVSNMVPLLIRENIWMSLPVSARTTAALKKSAGMVSNMVPLLIRVDESDTIGALTDQVATTLIGALRHQQFRRWPNLVADATRLGMNVEFGPIINILDFNAPLRFGSSEAASHVLTIFPIQDISVNVYPRLSDGVPRIDFWWNP